MAGVVDDKTRIQDSLRSTGHYSEVVAPGPTRDSDVEHLRSVARQVGREQGWKIRTLVAPPGQRADEAVVVHVGIRDGGTSLLHEQLLDARREKSMRRAVRGIDLPDP